MKAIGLFTDLNDNLILQHLDNNFPRPDENAQIYDDQDTLTQFGRLTRIYKALSPYIQAAVAQNTNDHKPVMRPLFLHYPDDPKAYDQSYEYMFGDDLLVAPVLEPGVDTWEVYLPGL